MQWLRNNTVRLIAGLLVGIAVVAAGFTMAPANGQQFQRTVKATFGFIIVDPVSGQERAFVCAPVPDNQEGVVTQ
ncbi:MAG: hypothetical protein E6Q97_03970 [Desulfurellales bacterium]|nr:MAG: hypothetical protein E6Q97_03970 [Desulfurellales bacterium]